MNMTKPNKSLFSKEEVINKILAIKQQDPDFRADYNLAVLISHNALCRVRDRANRDYGYHLANVTAKHLDHNVRSIIASLHDLVEDTDYTIDDLRLIGFDERVCAGVDALTKREGEKYLDFVERTKMNPDAVAVKLTDLKDNTDFTRFRTALPSEKDTTRQPRYIIAYNYLKDIHDNEISNSMNIVEYVTTHMDIYLTPQRWEALSSQPYPFEQKHAIRLEIALEEERLTNSILFQERGEQLARRKPTDSFNNASQGYSNADQMSPSNDNIMSRQPTFVASLRHNM
jgi:hypothetical protein